MTLRDQPEAASVQQLAMLLACFDGHKSAARSRKAIDAALRSRGDNLLDTVISEVNAKHAAPVYDPGRVAAGALVPALTWGIFGAPTGGGLAGAVASGLLGALLGGLWGYIGEHVWTKAQLARMGAGRCAVRNVCDPVLCRHQRARWSARYR
jgi:hypothetical protein